MISEILGMIWRKSPAAPAAGDPAPPLSATKAQDRRTVILNTAVNPALGWLSLRGVASDDRARVMLLAIAGQESNAEYRRQHGNGPARGLWQFEAGGGVRGVLMHRSSARAASGLCAWRGVAAEVPAVHAALERDDVLAAGFARLLLFTDREALPQLQAADAGWAYYLRTWRPGKPHPERWPENWRLAQQAVEG
jgi:hypothetical protein